MLSVFITPCCEADPHPCRDHACGARQTSPNQSPRRVSPSPRCADSGGGGRVDEARRDRHARPPVRSGRSAKLGDATDDRTGFVARMAVENMSRSTARQWRRAQRASSTPRWCMACCRGIADRRTQHGAAVGTARERRRPGALELQLPALAIRLTTSPSPIARPSPAGRPSGRTGGRRRPRRSACRAGSHCRRTRRRSAGRRCYFVEVEQGRDLVRMCDQPRRRHRRRRDGRPRGTHLAQARALFGIAGQFGKEGLSKFMERPD